MWVSVIFSLHPVHIKIYRAYTADVKSLKYSYVNVRRGRERKSVYLTLGAIRSIFATSLSASTNGRVVRWKGEKELFELRRKGCRAIH